MIPSVISNRFKVFLRTTTLVMLWGIFFTLSIDSGEGGMLNRALGFSPEQGDTITMHLVPLLEDLNSAHSVVAIYNWDLLNLLISVPENGHVLRLYEQEFDSLALEILDFSQELAPEAMAVSNGQLLFFTCYENGIIASSRFPFDDVETLHLPEWSLNGKPYRAGDVTVNLIGEIFVLDEKEERVFHFNANRDFLQTVDLPDIGRITALVSADEMLLMSSREAENVAVVTENGHKTASIGTFPELHRVRFYENYFFIISGNVIHIFNDSGEVVGNLKADIPEPIADIVIEDGNLYVLTGSTLFLFNPQH